jgi:hypothetical protein
MEPLVVGPTRRRMRDSAICANSLHPVRAGAQRASQPRYARAGGRKPARSPDYVRVLLPHHLTIRSFRGTVPHPELGTLARAE